MSKVIKANANYNWSLLNKSWGLLVELNYPLSRTTLDYHLHNLALFDDKLYHVEGAEVII